MTWPHPALPLLAAAALQGVVAARWRGPLAFAGAAGALAAVLAIPEDGGQRVALLGFELHVVSTDALSRLFALVFAVAACLGTLYALHVRRGGEQAAALAYAGAALGVVLAGDWLTLFLAWELMAVCSTAVIWHGGGTRARQAGFRYLYVHLTGGLLLFAGLVSAAPAATDAVGPVAGGAAFWLILAAVAVNAAIPPLHAWLPDAYPEASVTGSVFLSAFTTKAAVYVLLRCFPGAEVLVWAGVAMALYGVVFAVLENDIRRLLSYHIVSQVGYMVAGAGMGAGLAADGAAAHAFCHILYKALLFMGAGAVLESAGRRKLTELGGLAPEMKGVFALFMVGALSISGAPLLNGFVSKSMVVSAAAEAGRPTVEMLLTLAGVGTFLSIGLKLPYFTFFSRRATTLHPRGLPWNMVAAMAAAAALCIGLGLAPGWLYARLPGGTRYEPYTPDHVISAVQLLLGTAAAFALMRTKLKSGATVSLDTDRLYDRPLRRGLAWAARATRTAGRRLEHLGSTAATVLGRLATPAGASAGGHRLPIAVTVFWIAAALGLTALWLG